MPLAVAMPKSLWVWTASGQRTSARNDSTRRVIPPGEAIPTVSARRTRTTPCSSAAFAITFTNRRSARVASSKPMATVSPCRLAEAIASHIVLSAQSLSFCSRFSR
ncbi:MAG: hypothetical protein ACD_75C02360G0001 [uncultured bacterium]|nr:MAG: hypothetical protein ACD_75C02360G0001 [uncultured bacterium]